MSLDFLVKSGTGLPPPRMSGAIREEGNLKPMSTGRGYNFGSGISDCVRLRNIVTLWFKVV